jgi:hypothetical protein
LRIENEKKERKKRKINIKTTFSWSNIKNLEMCAGFLMIVRFLEDILRLRSSSSPPQP